MPQIENSYIIINNKTFLDYQRWPCETNQQINVRAHVISQMFTTFEQHTSRRGTNVEIAETPARTISYVVQELQHTTTHTQKETHTCNAHSLLVSTAERDHLQTWPIPQICLFEYQHSPSHKSIQRRFDFCGRWSYY